MEFLAMPVVAAVPTSGHVLLTYPLVLNGGPLVRACAWCGKDFAWKTPTTKKSWLGGYGKPRRCCSKGCGVRRVGAAHAAQHQTRRKRVCLGCGGTFPTSAFFQRADGRWGLYCRPCGEKKSAEGYSSPSTYLISALASARRRAATANRPFTLTIEWLRERAEMQQWLCHYTGRPMTTVYGRGRLPENLSLDRVDNSGGYTADNVVLCCVDINLAKQCYPIDHLIEMARMATARRVERGTAASSTEDIQ